MSAITFGLNRLLRTTILRRKRDDGAQEDLEPLPEACKTVLEFLEESFEVSQQGGRRGFQFQRCIPCSICSKNSPKKHIQWLGNFEKECLPCKDEAMSVVCYKRLFAGTVDSGEQLSEDMSHTEGSELEKWDFRGMLVRVSKDIGDDLNEWKVALSDHIYTGALEKAKTAIALFEVLIDRAIMKDGDIRILLETIKMTDSLHLRKHIPKCQPLDNMKITQFSKFRQSVMTFGKELRDDDIRKLVFYYRLRRQYSDGWSLIMDLQQELILADTDKSLHDFKAKLNPESSELEKWDFRGMLVRVSKDIGDDLNKWKVALSNHINTGALEKAATALSLFEVLIDRAIMKDGDIRILLETIKMTDSLHLRKHIPKCQPLDNMKITQFSKFRQSVMTFGKELCDDDITNLVFYYGLRRQYSDGWSLIMDLQQELILADTDKSLHDFKAKLNHMGLERLSNCLNR
ncbi:uncharacterized protein LOC117108821 [Anneissia japonica]|uniref:uncharacterized protein LOC117108821 n=1 Tax=Anneissia japonica TaxID=1529436 RepID=UPI001425B6EB|nr:uncharacterized protein LOC117108821 [Anneissia japonica]